MSFPVVASMLLTLWPIPTGQVAVPLLASWPKKLDLPSLMSLLWFAHALNRSNSSRRSAGIAREENVFISMQTVVMVQETDSLPSRCR